MKDIGENGTEIRLNPVGFVRSELKTPMLTAGDSGLELQEQLGKIREYHERVKNCVSDLVIFQPFVDLLDGLEDFSHILVLFWPHLIDPARRALKKVHPMGRKDLPLKGIFSTCSPARPNPVLVSTVQLLEIKGNVIKVKGLEAVDGSPLIDVKPYVQQSHGAAQSRVPEWMEKIHRELEDTGYEGQ